MVKAKVWLRRLLAVAVGYALIAVLGRFVAPRMLYPAPRPKPLPQALEHWVLSGELSQVHAAYRAPDAEQRVVVFFHGNGQQVADLGWLAGRLGRRGLGVLLVEYPGYGAASEATPTEASIYDAAKTALGELGKRGVGPERVVLMGQSLGSGVATEMAAQGLGERAVLISPYTSIPDVAARVVPLLPMSWILGAHSYDSLSKAPRVDVEVLVIAGDRDTLIPIEMSRRLSEALPSARFERRAGRAHNDLWQDDELIEIVVSYAQAAPRR